MSRRVHLSYPLDALVSYHYYRDDEKMRPLVATGRLELIGDSGAFSALTQGARIHLGEYANWCRRWWDHLCWAASLDVIGDPHASWRNWVTLRDKHQLVTVPTLHAGSSTTWLDAYAAEGVDLIGLGGMAGTGQAPRAYRWVVHMFRHARRRCPQVRFHLWGVTNRQFLDTLPAWSADSSGTLGQAYRYGTLRLFDPDTGRHINVSIRRGSDKRPLYRQAPLLRRVYGVDPADIETSHPGNRTLLIQVSAVATQQYAAWLQRRHQVTPPAMYRGHANIGARVHSVAEGYPGRRPVLVDAVSHGPRLHLVSSAAGGAIDDLTTTVTDRQPVGPRLHTVDAIPKHLLATTRAEGKPES